MQKLEVAFELNNPCTQDDVMRYLHDADRVVNFFSNSSSKAISQLKCEPIVKVPSFIWAVYAKDNLFDNEEVTSHLIKEIEENVKGGIFSNFAFEEEISVEGESLDPLERAYPDYWYQPIISPWNPKVTVKEWDGKSELGLF